MSISDFIKEYSDRNRKEDYRIRGIEDPFSAKYIEFENKAHGVFDNVIFPHLDKVASTLKNNSIEAQTSFRHSSDRKADFDISLRGGVRIEISLSQNNRNHTILSHCEAFDTIRMIGLNLSIKNKICSLQL